MRVAIFIYVCFTASTAVNSTQSNYSGTRDEVEKLRAIPSDIPRLSSNNSSLIRRLRQVDQPAWCHELTNQSTEGILSNCKELNGRLFILRIGKDVTEEAWKKFIGNVLLIDTIVEIIDSSLTEVVMTVYRLGSSSASISNNSKLKRIAIKGQQALELGLSIGELDIRGNPALKSIRIGAKEYIRNGLEISRNDELGTIEISASYCSQDANSKGKIKMYISNNPKLRRISINCTRSLTGAPIHIVGNKALTELDFPETVEDFGVREIHINDNDNLESIKIPATTKKFEVKNLEIRGNYQLKTIDLGEQTRWKDTELVVRENALLSSEIVETLKKMEWKSMDIQDIGEGLTTTTTTATPAKTTASAPTTTETATSGGEVISIAIFPFLLIL